SIWFDDDSVGVCPARFLQYLAGAVRPEHTYVSRVGLAARGVFPSRVSEVETAVGTEGKVVWRAEYSRRRLGDHRVHVARGTDALDRGRLWPWRSPGADDPAVLGDVDVAVRANCRGVGAASYVGMLLDTVLAVPGAEASLKSLDEDDPAVIEHRRPFRPA